jgi:hypothetical protein
LRAAIVHVSDRFRPTSLVLAALILSVLLVGCPEDERDDWAVSDDAGGQDASGDADVFNDTDTAEDEALTCWFEANEQKADRCVDSDQEDSDVDGLSDEEELSLCTDPADDDTDDDGMYDCEELELGLDPCAADTDGDGFDDNAEAELCFDPTDPSRPTQEQEWIFTACETASPDLVDTEVSENGSWSYVTGRWIEGFSNASYNGDQSRPSLATFEIPDIDGQGAVVSFPVQGFGMPDSLDAALSSLVESSLQEFSEVTPVREGEVEKPESNYLVSKWQSFEVRSTAAAPTSEVRDQAAMAVAGLKEEQFSGWPETGDSSAERFIISVGLSVAYQDRCMPRESGERIGFAVLAVTPTGLDDRARSIRRMVSSPRRLNWGSSRTTRWCRRFPLAAGSGSSDDGEEGSDDFVLDLDHWIPGTATVRAGGEEVDFGATTGYGYEASKQDLMLSQEAIPDALPRSNYRFASVRWHVWNERCRGPCWGNEACWEGR